MIDQTEKYDTCFYLLQGKYTTHGRHAMDLSFTQLKTKITTPNHDLFAKPSHLNSCLKCTTLKH